MRTSASPTLPSPSVQALVRKLWAAYDSATPAKLKVLDAYMAFVMLTGVIQFVYCALVGSYPFNAFLGGFASTVCSFVLAANLRIQTNPQNKLFAGRPERAFADFAFCHVLLHLFAFHFLG